MDAKFVKGKHLFIGKIFIIILKMRNATIYDFALIFICRRPEKTLILIFSETFENAHIQSYS